MGICRNEKRKFYKVLALGQGPFDAIEQVWIDDLQLDLLSDGTPRPPSKFRNGTSGSLLRIQTRLGVTIETAYSKLVSTFTEWTAQHRGDGIFDANLQDRLAFHLLKRRGYEDFVSGKIGRAEFGKRLAQEWASLPVLTAVKGAHHDLKRGQSFYAGDPLNKSLVSPEKVEAVLDRVKAAPSVVSSVPVGSPVPQIETCFWASVFAAIAALFGGGK